MPSIPGLRESKPFTHIEALELDHVPEQLVILGGGYVGLEFAQAFRRFGSRVTVIEGNARLLEGEDDDIAHAVTAVLTGEGIEVVNNVVSRRSFTWAWPLGVSLTPAVSRPMRSVLGVRPVATRRCVPSRRVERPSRSSSTVTSWPEVPCISLTLAL